MADRTPGFFDLDDQLAELSARGDDLERVKVLVDFEMFRPALEAAAPRADWSKAGRPAFDHVLMFTVLVLQAMHALSDERTEVLIKDRLSFMRFLSLGLTDSIPDADTIWTFGRLSGDERADRGRHDRGRPQATQHAGGEGGDQGRPYP